MLRLFLAVLLPIAHGVTVQELKTWFWSSSGLDMSMQDADQLAQVEAPILTECVVSMDALKAMYDVLYKTTNLDLSKQLVREKILPLAKQHADPTVLKDMFNGLYSTRGLDTTKDVAQKWSIELVQSFRAEPGQLIALFNALKDSLKLPKEQAQTKAIGLAAVGCDATALVNSFKASKDLTSATDSAVRANLNGASRRFAQDGKVYTAKEFQDYYGASYLSEWMKGAHEKKVSRDGWAYTASEFHLFFASAWETEWNRAAIATQRRLGEDGKPYTISEFVDYYRDEWQQKWLDAPELPCKECKSAVETVTV
mmetsp:Transcript_16844/g.39116  ORF Transcript_16844/g.39116 Transcript_16844/m.39116 type:complete len:311 (+) Transcript_16844:50-982(+)